ncbi:MAG: Uma2 family endonuclease [Microcystaceae cyanobacterium]
MLTKERVYSPSEYLVLEEQANERHEFIDGEIRPMAGGTTKHNELVTNLCLILKPKMRKLGWRIYTENVKLEIPDFGIFTYPDVMLIAGEPLYAGESKTTVLNPIAIFEVLSEGTRDYDQGRKFEFYRSILSLQEYVLIDQEQHFIMVYRRTEANDWLLHLWDQEADYFPLESVGIKIAFADVYEDF